MLHRQRKFLFCGADIQNPGENGMAQGGKKPGLLRSPGQRFRIPVFPKTPLDIGAAPSTIIKEIMGFETIRFFITFEAISTVFFQNF